VKRDPYKNPEALAGASLALSEMMLRALVGKNIITVEQVKDIILKASFALENMDDALSKDVEALLIDVLKGLESPPPQNGSETG
jgi:NifU-like protein involved in Fe-S cluster formation